mmetsp:Transcript_14369/g.31457  ORF Transcript_14369/g.31457 Transcript_14369/m.31457 type:complete len:87 (-) Transcript_14369:148-408(-)
MRIICGVSTKVFGSMLARGRKCSSPDVGEQYVGNLLLRPWESRFVGTCSSGEQSPDVAAALKWQARDIMADARRTPTARAKHLFTL